MTCWEIVDGEGRPRSFHYSNLRSPRHAARILAEWRAMNPHGSPSAAGARPYAVNALDNYGVRRGG
jgi:hypothetical protein